MLIRRIRGRIRSFVICLNSVEELAIRCRSKAERFLNASNRWPTTFLREADELRHRNRKPLSRVVVKLCPSANEWNGFVKVMRAT